MENQRRLAMGVEYDGTHYNGWQYQPHAPSIQERLNVAISAVADETVSCIGSGRTDTGVHARGQVVHFDSRAERSPRAWLLGINSNLPDDINVLWIKEIDSEFHARYSAYKTSVSVLDSQPSGALRSCASPGLVGAPTTRCVGDGDCRKVFARVARFLVFPCGGLPVTFAGAQHDVYRCNSQTRLDLCRLRSQRLPASYGQEYPRFARRDRSW